MKKSGAYASKPQTDPTWPENDCSPEQRVREGEDGWLAFVLPPSGAPR